MGSWRGMTRRNHHFGEVYWSDYFKSEIVVVRYDADDQWWFVVRRRPTQMLRARTPLSEMSRRNLLDKTTNVLV